MSLKLLQGPELTKIACAKELGIKKKREALEVEKEAAAAQIKAEVLEAAAAQEHEDVQYVRGLQEPTANEAQYSRLCFSAAQHCCCVVVGTVPR